MSRSPLPGFSIADCSVESRQRRAAHFANEALRQSTDGVASVASSRSRTQKLRRVLHFVPQPPENLNHKERRERKEKQVLGYLKSARLEHALLINFGSYKFELRKFAWSQDASCRKSKPSFLFSVLSAFSAFFVRSP